MLPTDLYPLTEKRQQRKQRWNNLITFTIAILLAGVLVNIGLNTINAYWLGAKWEKARLDNLIAPAIANYQKDVRVDPDAVINYIAEVFYTNR